MLDCNVCKVLLSSFTYLLFHHFHRSIGCRSRVLQFLHEYLTAKDLIATTAATCTSPECECAMHPVCERNYFSKSAHKKCPVCQEVWDAGHPGARRKQPRHSQDLRSRRASGDQVEDEHADMVGHDAAEARESQRVRKMMRKAVKAEKNIEASSDG